MDDLTKKVHKILVKKYGQEFDKGWFENGTLFKNIIKATEEALTIPDVNKSVCVQTGLECGFPCHSECPLYDKLKP